LRLELHVQCMVAAGAEASAHVDSRVLRVRLSGAFRAARGEIIKGARSSSGRISGGDQRVAQIQLAGAELVDVFDVIEVNAVRAALTKALEDLPTGNGRVEVYVIWNCVFQSGSAGLRVGSLPPPVATISIAANRASPLSVDWSVHLSGGTEKATR
jgi:hypothetical protein